MWNEGYVVAKTKIISNTIIKTIAYVDFCKLPLSWFREQHFKIDMSMYLKRFSVDIFKWFIL